MIAKKGTTAGDDFEILRVEQQRAELAVRRRRVHGCGKIEPRFARNFDKSAVARKRATARADGAVTLGAVVRPDDDFAAVAGRNGVGADDRIRPEIGAARVLYQRIAALIVAADERQTATNGARHVDYGPAQQSHTRCEQQHHAARAVAAGGINQPGSEQRALGRLHPHFAARMSIREDTAGGIKRDFVMRGDGDVAAATFATCDGDGSLQHDRAFAGLHN